METREFCCESSSMRYARVQPVIGPRDYEHTDSIAMVKSAFRDAAWFNRGAGRRLVRNRFFLGETVDADTGGRPERLKLVEGRHNIRKALGL